MSSRPFYWNALACLLLLNHIQEHCLYESTCREYDVPYHVRVSIDLKITVSRWYCVFVQGSSVPPEIKLREDLLDLPVSEFRSLCCALFNIHGFFTFCKETVG